MKKLSLLMIVVWSFIGLLIIAVLMLSTIFLNKEERSAMFSFASDRSDMQLVVDETIPIRGIDKIELSFSSDECNVYFSDDDKISVKHYAHNIPEGRYARIDTSGGVLTVSTMPTGFGGLTLFSFLSHSNVDITLPAAYREALSINIMSGTLRFNGDLDLSELAVKISSGTIRTENLLKARDIGIKVTSGSVRVTGGIEAENYMLKTSSGTIDIGNKLAGSGSVNATSGSVRLAGVDITDSLSVKVSSGTINIGIAGDPSINFSGHKSSGTIRTYFYLPKDGSTVTATVGKAPYKNLDVSVTSGTIRITQE